LLRLSRGVEQFDDLLAWFHEAEGFAWPVAEELNDRLRKTLGFMRPSEKIIELLDTSN